MKKGLKLSKKDEELIICGVYMVFAHPLLPLILENPSGSNLAGLIRAGIRQLKDSMTPELFKEVMNAHQFGLNEQDKDVQSALSEMAEYAKEHGH